MGEFLQELLVFGTQAQDDVVIQNQVLVLWHVLAVIDTYVFGCELLIGLHFGLNALLDAHVS